MVLRRLNTVPLMVAPKFEGKAPCERDFAGPHGPVDPPRLRTEGKLTIHLQILTSSEKT